MEAEEPSWQAEQAPAEQSALVKAEPTSSTRPSEALVVAPSGSSWTAIGFASHALSAVTGAPPVAEEWAPEREPLRRDAQSMPYAVLERLGEGAFAECVRLRDTEGRVYAGKLCPKRELTEAQRRRLARLAEATKLGLFGVATEIEIHGSLQHRNIVALHEFFFDHLCGKLVMVMQFCLHGTLRRVLRRVADRILPVRAVQRWMHELLSALSYLHGIGVAHRDVNPDNLLIDDELSLQLCDFGFACRLRADGRHAESAENARSAVGTLNYIAPEVLLSQEAPIGEGPIGPDLRAADIWAAGVVIHELLAGTVPFVFQKPESVPVELLLPAEERVKLSLAAVDLIASTLHRSPEARPDASALLSHAFFGGTFCAFPGTAAGLAADAAARGEAVSRIEEETEAVAALPPSPPSGGMAALPPSPPAAAPPTAPAGAAPIAAGLVAPVAGLLSVPMPTPAVIASEPEPSGARALAISPSRQRSLAISPGRLSPGRELPLASGLLHMLGVDSQGVPLRQSDPQPQPAAEALTWILLLTLNPTLDALWIRAAADYLATSMSSAPRRGAAAEARLLADADGRTLREEPRALLETGEAESSEAEAAEDPEPEGVFDIAV